jgi:hypothetical protein
MTTVAAGSTVNLNSGTILPTKVMYLSGSANAGGVRFAIGTSVNVSLGAFLPTASVGAPYPAPLELPLDDAAKVWVFASVAASVGCTYRT